MFSMICICSTNFKDHSWIKLRKPIKVKIMHLFLFTWCMFDSRDERIYWKKNLYFLMEYNNSLFHFKCRLIMKLMYYIVSPLKLGVCLNSFKHLQETHFISIEGKIQLMVLRAIALVIQLGKILMMVFEHSYI
jgi:hypothetical protein